MNIQELLQLAINENKQIRDQALNEIDQNFIIIKDYLFIEPIDQLKIIYINYWIEQNYKNYQLQDVKQVFKQQVFQLYSQTKSQLLEKSIINLIQYDFPNDISILQQLVQLDVPIKHKVIKRLFKEFGLTTYLQQFIQLQQQNEFHEPYIKILIQQSRILPYNGDILKYINAIQKSIPLNNSRIVYLYQKAIIASLQYQKNQPSNDVVELIKFINQYYLSIQHNVDLVDISQFEQQLQFYKQQKNKNQQLITQILLILKQIVLNFTLTTYLDLYVGYEEVELWLFEKCLGNILNFILNYSLILTPSQVYDVFYENEAYYAEENDESYEIRQLSIDLLKLACDGMNQDNVIEQIVQRIDFNLQITDYLSMIKKEAMYYILADLQDIINFDFDKYFNMFISELSNLQFQHILLPLKVQIWRIIKNQVQSNEEMPLDVIISIIDAIQKLYAKDNCCFLIQIEIINLIFDHCPHDFISQIWVELQNRYDTLQYQQSKLIVFEFYKNTIKLNNDFQWMLQKYSQEWNNANLNMQTLIIDVLQDINQNYNIFYQQSLEFVNYCYLSKETILIESGTKLLVIILSKGYKVNQQQCEFYQKTLLDHIIDNIDLWKQGLQLQIYLYQNPFNKELFYQCLIKQLKMRDEIKSNVFKNLFILLELVHKDVYINYFEYLKQDEFYYEYIHLIGLQGQRGPDLDFQQLIPYYLKITDIHRAEVFINLLRVYLIDDSMMRVYLEELKSKQLEPQQSQFLLSLKSI